MWSSITASREAGRYYFVTSIFIEKKKMTQGWVVNGESPR
jgi:hypothetical protein